MTLEERAREVLAEKLGDGFRSGYVRTAANNDRGHIVRPAEALAAMLTFAAKERERAAEVADAAHHELWHADKRAKQYREALGLLNAHVEAMQAIMVAYLTKECDQAAFVDRMLGMLDGPEQRAVQDQVRQAL